MKVLMIGREYPPKRSGGLGTACYNLTNGQTKLMDAEVTFVVPTLFGGENKSNIKLIGACVVSAIDLKINLKEFNQVVEFMNVSSTFVHHDNPADDQQQNGCHAEGPIHWWKLTSTTTLNSPENMASPFSRK